MSDQKGQSLIELVVALGVFVIVTSALAYLVLNSYVAGRLGQEITQANFLAEEGLERARSIRDNNWQDLMIGESTETIDGKFIRTIKVDAIDANRKKVTSKITWPFSGSKTQEISLVTYLTNWQKGLEIKKPTARTDNTVWTTPALAYNYPDTPNDQSDSGSDTSMPTRDPAILFYSWALKTETYTATVLKVNWRTNGLHSNDQFAIRYTKDGGINWLDLVPMGVHNETTIQTSSASLDANQVLTSVQVKVVSTRFPNPSADGGTLYIYDIWTEGVF
jgi:type II secretory pathway pseudopilin PulG